MEATPLQDATYDDNLDDDDDDDVVVVDKDGGGALRAWSAALDVSYGALQHWRSAVLNYLDRSLATFSRDTKSRSSFYRDTVTFFQIFSLSCLYVISNIMNFRCHYTVTFYIEI